MVRRGVLIYERRRKDIALKGLYAGLASTVDGSHEAVRYFLEEFGCKQQTGGPQVDHTRQAVLQYLDPLNQEIRRAAEYVQSQYPDSPVELLLVSGGGAHIAAATERLQATLGIEARAAAPERAVECVPALPRLSPGMAAALGLALFPVATR
jgi:Tfp pilus assembly PilM family ATPase